MMLTRIQPAAVLIFTLCSLAQVQNDQTAQVSVVIANADSSNAVIAVPPETSWTATLSLSANNPKYRRSNDDLAMWVRTQSGINGLQGPNLQPWRVVIAYDEFDEDGDNVNSGIFEELWAGPKSYRRRYTSDKLNQTDYVTEHGLFRVGDQRWPGRVEQQVRNEIVDPFYYAATLNGLHTRTLERAFGPHILDCVALESDMINSSPTQYCFGHGDSALRYVRGEGWLQTAYNDIVSFQGRDIAREVDVTDAGKPHLKLKVQALELLSSVDPKDLQPPAEAVNLQGKRLSGVSPRTLHVESPRWPSALREQHFTVAVELVIGKDGHVLSAQAVSGPAAAFSAAESTARKWLFQPYLVGGEPAEVETTIMMSKN